MFRSILWHFDTATKSKMVMRSKMAASISSSNTIATKAVLWYSRRWYISYGRKIVYSNFKGNQTILSIDESIRLCCVVGVVCFDFNLKYKYKCQQKNCHDYYEKKKLTLFVHTKKLKFKNFNFSCIIFLLLILFNIIILLHDNFAWDHKYSK